jgi:ribosomal protein L40E
VGNATCTYPCHASKNPLNYVFFASRVDLGEKLVMGIRPRTDHVMNLKSRRCPKCGGKINSQKTRCKRCHEVQSRPKKKNKASG